MHFQYGDNRYVGPQWLNDTHAPTKVTGKTEQTQNGMSDFADPSGERGRGPEGKWNTEIEEKTSGNTATHLEQSSKLHNNRGNEWRLSGANEQE